MGAILRQLLGAFWRSPDWRRAMRARDARKFRCATYSPPRSRPHETTASIAFGKFLHKVGASISSAGESGDPPPPGVAASRTLRDAISNANATGLPCTRKGRCQHLSSRDHTGRRTEWDRPRETFERRRACLDSENRRDGLYYGLSAPYGAVYGSVFSRQCFKFRAPTVPT